MLSEASTEAETLEEELVCVVGCGTEGDTAEGAAGVSWAVVDVTWFVVEGLGGVAPRCAELVLKIWELEERMSCAP